MADIDPIQRIYTGLSTDRIQAHAAGKDSARKNPHPEREDQGDRIEIESEVEGPIATLESEPEEPEDGASHIDIAI